MSPLLRKILGYAFAIVFVFAGWWITAVLVNTSLRQSVSADREALGLQEWELQAALGLTDEALQLWHSEGKIPPCACVILRGPEKTE